MSGLTTPSKSKEVSGQFEATELRRKAILVVGVSRSGTSLVSHLIHTLGAAVPDELLGADYGNPLGHWEPKVLLEINSEILAAMGSTWRDPWGTNRQWFSSRESYDFLLRIVHQLQVDYREQALILIKDPRIVRLLPIYLAALDMLDIDPLVVLQVRHPSEVSASLWARDQIRPELAELLWLRGVTEAEFETRSCRRTWVSLDKVADDWQGCMLKVGKDLGINWPNTIENVVPIVQGFLKPRFLHRNVPESPVMSALAMQAWDATEQGIRGQEALACLRYDDIRVALGDIDLFGKALIADCEQFRPVKRLSLLSTFVRLMRRVSLGSSSSRTAPR